MPKENESTVITAETNPLANLSDTELTKQLQALLALQKEVQSRANAKKSANAGRIAELRYEIYSLREDRKPSIQAEVEAMRELGTLMGVPNSSDESIGFKVKFSAEETKKFSVKYAESKVSGKSKK